MCRILTSFNATVVLADVCVVRVRVGGQCVQRDLLFLPEAEAPRCLPPGAVLSARATALAPCAAGTLAASARGAKMLGMSAKQPGVPLSLVNQACPNLAPRGPAPRSTEERSLADERTNAWVDGLPYSDIDR